MLNLLMSDAAIRQYGYLIESITSVRLIAFDTRPEQIEQAEQSTHINSYPIRTSIDIGFLTRDITGASTKTQILPPLARYYELLRASPRLKWVHAHSAGADRPIYSELLAQGVQVTTSAGANAAPVAHTAVAAVLALGRQFPVQIAAQHKREYTPMTNHPRLHDLTGQTALVLGLGAIGSRIKRYLEALDIQVIGVSRNQFSQLHRYLPSIDFLILACPLNPLTHGLVDAKLLAQMKRGSYLVNVARGEVCVEADVIAALQSNQLGGAFLDGFETEPLSPDSPLWALSNVMLSAHTAGHFTGLGESVVKLFTENLARFVQGRELLNQLRITS